MIKIVGTKQHLQRTLLHRPQLAVRRQTAKRGFFPPAPAAAALERAAFETSHSLSLSLSLSQTYTHTRTQALAKYCFAQKMQKLTQKMLHTRANDHDHAAASKQKKAVHVVEHSIIVRSFPSSLPPFFLEYSSMFSLLRLFFPLLHFCVFVCLFVRERVCVSFCAQLVCGTSRRAR